MIYEYLIDSNLIHKFGRFLQRKSYSYTDIPEQYKKGDFTIIFDHTVYVGYFDSKGCNVRNIIRLKDCLLHSDYLPAIEIISNDRRQPNIKQYYQNGKLHNTRDYAIIVECIECSQKEYCSHIGNSVHKYFLEGKFLQKEEWENIKYKEWIGKFLETDKRLYKDIISIITKY